MFGGRDISVDAVNQLTSTGWDNKNKSQFKCQQVKCLLVQNSSLSSRRITSHLELFTRGSHHHHEMHLLNFPGASEKTSNPNLILYLRHFFHLHIYVQEFCLLWHFATIKINTKYTFSESVNYMHSHVIILSTDPRQSCLLKLVFCPFFREY